jgi:hypothetical protein
MKETTYCPEDNKLRLYIGRVPREEYEALRDQGWKSTPKQDCDFVAPWTPDREDMALDYSPIGIGDEDQSPEDRAAARAERFSNYRDKREDEAINCADKYDAGPKAHGYQSPALATRRARQHDRTATKALSQWQKADYWQHRTAGVIRNALHKASAGVRMGRIKILEAEIRKRDKSFQEYADRYESWKICASMSNADNQTELAKRFAYVTRGHYTHPRTGQRNYLYEHIRGEDPLSGVELCALWFSQNTEPTEPGGRWYNHLKLRLAYEEQMLEAQGGRAAHIEMIPGGFLGSRQIQKVNKSSATGRVVSVVVWRETRRVNADNQEPCLLKINTERMGQEVYRAPTNEELKAFEQAKRDARKVTSAANKKNPKPTIINPTEEDARCLQAVWNKTSAKSAKQEIKCMTQATYSANSKGSYSAGETVEVTGGGFKKLNCHHLNLPTVAKFREYQGRVIVLTDKPQKKIPETVWHDPRPEIIEEVLGDRELLVSSCGRQYKDDMTAEERVVFDKGRTVGLAYSRSWSQFGLTDKGAALLKERRVA